MSRRRLNLCPSRQQPFLLLITLIGEHLTVLYAVPDTFADGFWW